MDSKESLARNEAEYEGLPPEWERVKEKVRELLADPDQKCVGKIEFRTGHCGVRHYGIWHDKYEAWYRLDGSLFMTDSYALALFQLEAVPDLGWRVRCIEEWADEQAKS